LAKYAKYVNSSKPFHNVIWISTKDFDAVKKANIDVQWAIIPENVKK
jgi:hypothetical protein